MLFSLLKYFLDLYLTDTALKVSTSLYCFTTSICHSVENYVPGCGVFFLIFVVIINRVQQVQEVKKKFWPNLYN